MPKITMAEFSRIKAVSRPAIKKAVVTGRIILTDGLVDTDNPINAIYNPRGQQPPAPEKKKPAPKKKEPKKKKEKPVIAPDDLDDDGLTEEERREISGAMGNDMATWTLRDKKAAALLKEASERRLTLAHQIKKGELIERSQFVAAVQGINKAIDDHLHRLPAKLGPVIFAMARRDGATELEVIRAIEVDMGSAIRRATEDVSRLEP